MKRKTAGRPPLRRDEHAMKTDVVQYLKEQYPDAVFSFRLKGRKHDESTDGLSNLIVLAARNGYHGLCMELKADGERVFKEDGTPATTHIAEQKAVLDRLEGEGYWAGFVVGFDRAKEVIDNYMEGV